MVRNHSKIWWIFFVLVFVSFTWSFNLKAETPPTILTAYATSVSEDSTAITDLLQLGKEGLWKPKTSDSGVQEGIYIQFTAPVAIDWIEVQAKNGVSGECRLAFYLDGKKNIIPRSKTIPKQADSERVEYWVAHQDRGNDRLFYLGARKAESYSEKEYAFLNAKVRAVYIKVAAATAVPQLATIRFYRRDQKKPLQLVAPKSVTGKAVASLMLQPQSAYGVQNLFDSRTEFAWATDGKKSDGIGETVSLQFDATQNLSGIMIWNGYQRSDTHYYANSRVAKLSVKINEQPEFTLAVADHNGLQLLRFPKLFVDVKNMTMKITGIYPGKSYKDLAISEMKLVDQENNPLLFTIPPIRQDIPQSLSKLVDIALVPYMLGIVWAKDKMDKNYTPDYESAYDYPYCSIRLRSNGSFVGYSKNNFVVEGSWEPISSGVRIFGKKYLTYSDDAVYMQNRKQNKGVKIFQDSITIYDMTKTPFAVVKKYFKTLLAERSYYQLYRRNPGTMAWWSGTKPGKVKVTGKSEKELIKACYDLAVASKAHLLVSPLFTDLFLPNEQVEQLYEY
jgi:hypothetical protein